MPSREQQKRESQSKFSRACQPGDSTEPLLCNQPQPVDSYSKEPSTHNPEPMDEEHQAEVQDQKKHKHHKVRCAACKCQYFQSKVLPHTWVSNGPCTSLPTIYSGWCQPFPAHPQEQESLPLHIFNTFLFLYVCYFFYLQPSMLSLTLPHVAVYTALVFANRHLLISFHYSGRQSDTLPTTCLRILCWGLFSF